MIIVIASFISIIVGVGSLAWGFAEFGLDSLARWIVYFGVAWLFAQARRWWWFSAVGLVVIVLIAGFGLVLAIPAGWMFSAGIFALIAWDLTEFRRRYRLVKSNELRDLTRRHIARISSLAAVGLFLSSLVMLLRSQFTFEWTIFLVVVGVLGLTQLFAWIQKK